MHSGEAGIMSECLIRAMNLADYDAVISLLQQTEGVRLRDADSFEATSRYLERNPGMSFVAVVGSRLVGCAMAGHDGRRGYLQHVLVLPDYRSRGIGRRLVYACLNELKRHGIGKVHLDVLEENISGQAFWQQLGWQHRTDIRKYSLVLGDSPNA